MTNDCSYIQPHGLPFHHQSVHVSQPGNQSFQQHSIPSEQQKTPQTSQQHSSVITSQSSVNQRTSFTSNSGWTGNASARSVQQFFRFPNAAHGRRQSTKRGRSSSTSPSCTGSPYSEHRFRPPLSEQSQHSVKDLVQNYPMVTQPGYQNM